METVKLEVGQKLWWVPARHRYEYPCWVEVTKVGRVYATISPGNIRIRLPHLESVNPGGYRDSGRCYVSKEACEARKVVQEKWDEMRFNMRFNSLPDDVTVEQVEAAMRLLGL